MRLHHRRVVAALTPLAALLPLTACGIQQTDVIEAGGPATVDVLPAREMRMLLFFFSPDGALLPVPRYMEDEGFGDEYSRGIPGSEDAAQGEVVLSPTEMTVAALLAGPNEEERRAGLRSALSLPAGTTSKTVTVSPRGDAVEVVIPAPLKGLSAPARRQLVCTLAYAESADGRLVVTLRGTDAILRPSRCDIRSGPTATAGTDPG